MRRVLARGAAFPPDKRPDPVPPDARPLPQNAVRRGSSAFATAAAAAAAPRRGPSGNGTDDA